MRHKLPREAVPLRKIMIGIAITAISTVVVMLGAAEIAARLLWPQINDPSCLIPDSRLGHRYRPNCERQGRIPEGVAVLYRYNSCGLRGTAPCGPAPNGALRVAVLGSSFSHGAHVDVAASFPELMAKELAKLCRRPVDLQNFSVEAYALIDQYRRLDDALRSRPAMVVLFVVPNDLFEIFGQEEIGRRGDPNIIRHSKVFNPPEENPIRLFLYESRLATMIKHYLFTNVPFYIRNYVARGDTAGYLSTAALPNWERRYSDARLLISEMAERTRAAGSRLVVAALPQRVQAAMLESGADSGLRDGAAAFGQRLGAIARADAPIFIDALSLIADQPRPTRLFYPYDGHLTLEGHRIVGAGLAKALFADRSVCEAR